MQITLDINESKYEAFWAFIKTLDYVSVKTNETNFALSDDQKSILNERREDYLKGKSKTYSWEEVQKLAKKSK